MAAEGYFVWGFERSEALSEEALWDPLCVFLCVALLWQSLWRFSGKLLGGREHVGATMLAGPHTLC